MTGTCSGKTSVISQRALKSSNCSRWAGPRCPRPVPTHSPASWRAKFGRFPIALAGTPGGHRRRTRHCPSSTDWSWPRSHSAWGRRARRCRGPVCRPHRPRPEHRTTPSLWSWEFRSTELPGTTSPRRPGGPGSSTGCSKGIRQGHPFTASMCQRRTGCRDDAPPPSGDRDRRGRRQPRFPAACRLGVPGAWSPRARARRR